MGFAKWEIHWKVIMQTQSAEIQICEYRAKKDSK